MAIGALRERQSCISRLAVAAGGMALFTLHLRVQAGQRIPRFGVIKLGRVDCLPVVEVMTLLATRTQPSLVRILMASSASLWYPQKTARQVLHLDRSALLRCDVIGTVAASTSHAGMFSFEKVSGEFVVESLGVPFHQWKILAVMLRVTARTLFARPRRNVVGGVEALVSGHTSCNLSVAFDALQRSSRTELMA
jgi:hypothetical protein